jgi:hypothetical protein
LFLKSSTAFPPCMTHFIFIHFTLDVQQLQFSLLPSIKKFWTFLIKPWFIMLRFTMTDSNIVTNNFGGLFTSGNGAYIVGGSPVWPPGSTPKVVWLIQFSSVSVLGPLHFCKKFKRNLMCLLRNGFHTEHWCLTHIIVWIILTIFIWNIFWFAETEENCSEI